MCFGTLDVISTTIFSHFAACMLVETLEVSARKIVVLGSENSDGDIKSNSNGAKSNAREGSLFIHVVGEGGV